MRWPKTYHSIPDTWNPLPIWYKTTGSWTVPRYWQALRFHRIPSFALLYQDLHSPNQVGNLSYLLCSNWQDQFEVRALSLRSCIMLLALHSALMRLYWQFLLSANRSCVRLLHLKVPKPSDHRSSVRWYLLLRKTVSPKPYCPSHSWNH